MTDSKPMGNRSAYCGSSSSSFTESQLLSQRLKADTYWLPCTRGCQAGVTASRVASVLKHRQTGVLLLLPQALLLAGQVLHKAMCSTLV